MPNPSPHHQELVKLLQRSAAQDAQAFEQLYRLSSGALFAVLLRMLKDRAQAEDLLQECYLRIWRRAASYHPDKGAPLAWLQSIARNSAVDWLRTQKASTVVAVDDEADWHPALIDTAQSPLAFAEQQTGLAALHRGLGQLSPPERTSLLMAYYEGKTHQEISAELQVPVGTAKSWIRRGLQKIRGQVDPPSKAASPALRQSEHQASRRPARTRPARGHIGPAGLAFR